MTSLLFLFLAIQSVELPVDDQPVGDQSSAKQPSTTIKTSDEELTQEHKEVEQGPSLSFLSIAETAPHATQEYANLYTPLEIEYTESNALVDGQVYKYRLYQPQNLKPDEKAPMLVWLHGQNESGSNNFLQLRWLHNMLGFTEQRLKDRKVYLLAMQCPERTSWRDTNQNVLKAIIDHTVDTNSVDEDRVYLSGISAGGNGCWSMAIRYPETFAAILSLSGVGGSIAEVERLKNIPIWAFYKTFDRGIEQVKQIVDGLENAGGRVHLTEQKGMGHIVTINRYPGLLDWWLFAQERGKPASFRPPGVIKDVDYRIIEEKNIEDKKGNDWQPHQLAIQIIVPTLVAIACLQEYRRRHTLRLNHDKKSQ